MLNENQRQTLELAVRIADDAARADIETRCPSFTGDGREPANAEEIRAAWYDTAGACRECAPHVQTALHYLTLRGRLILHPSRNGWVRLACGQEPIR